MCRLLFPHANFACLLSSRRHLSELLLCYHRTIIILISYIPISAAAAVCLYQFICTAVFLCNFSASFHVYRNVGVEYFVRATNSQVVLLQLLLLAACDDAGVWLLGGLTHDSIPARQSSAGFCGRRILLSHCCFGLFTTQQSVVSKVVCRLRKYINF